MSQRLVELCRQCTDPLPHSVGKQIVNVPSFVVRLDSQKVSPLHARRDASVSLTTSLYFPTLLHLRLAFLPPLSHSPRTGHSSPNPCPPSDPFSLPSTHSTSTSPSLPPTVEDVTAVSSASAPRPPLPDPVTPRRRTMRSKLALPCSNFLPPPHPRCNASGRLRDAGVDGAPF